MSRFRVWYSQHDPRYNYGTLTIRPSKALYKDIVNIFDEIYSPLLQISGLTLTLAFQAVPVSAVRAGIKRGGNPTGLAEKPQLSETYLFR